MIYRSQHERDCQEQAIVLKVAGIGYGVQRAAGEFVVVVAAEDAARAREELDAYASENRVWATVAAAVPHRGGGYVGTLGFSLLLLLAALLERWHLFGVHWFDVGRAQAGLIRDGQWWRAVTALTLHVDPLHLAGNVVIGGLIALFASQALGSGLASFSMLLAGTCGNLLNAWIRPEGHNSVGASTAVFGALGIVAAHAWQLRRTMRTPGLRRWAPLVAGIVLLSFLGTGGVRTDVAAHVAGFVFGLLLGALSGKLARRASASRGAQLAWGMAALALIVVGWALALTSPATTAP